jgi:hypothetical protein
MDFFILSSPMAACVTNVVIACLNNVACVIAHAYAQRKKSLLATCGIARGL